jgi:hypothetical protein
VLSREDVLEVYRGAGSVLKNCSIMTAALAQSIMRSFCDMAMIAKGRRSIDLSAAWWKESIKVQWFAWTAAWLAWRLHDLLFIMVPIAKEFGASVTGVAAVLALTIWF